MLQNKLAKILYDKRIKAVEISRETGISKATLSKITNNLTERIEYDTINKICLFLNIQPGEFFEYFPMDYKFEFEGTDLTFDFSKNDVYELKSFEITSLAMEMIIDITMHNFQRTFYVEISSKITEYDTNQGLKKTLHVTPKFKSEEEKEMYKNLIEQIPSSFTYKLDEEIRLKFEATIQKLLNEKMKDLFNDEESEEIISYVYSNEIEPVNSNLKTFQIDFNF